MRWNSTTYRYPGFIERKGVRYLGQSVLFVTSPNLPSLREFLCDLAVDHVVTPAALGSVEAELSPRSEGSSIPGPILSTPLTS